MELSPIAHVKELALYSVRLLRCSHGRILLVAACLGSFSATVLARIGLGDQRPAPGKASAVYAQLRAFPLGFRSVPAENLVLKRDRVTITFREGALYFPAPIDGSVRGAVFLGRGTFQAAPPDDLERDYVRRMLKADEVASDFKTAVLRFTDDSYSVLGEGARRDPAPPRTAVKLAAELDPRVLKETGANLSARQLVSILNQESPGFFFGEFDGGRRKRFDFVLDAQSRLPASNFGIDAGERGLIYAFDQILGRSDVWMAFHGEEEYRSGVARYADADDLILVTQYGLDVDVTKPSKFLNVTARMQCVSRSDHLIAIPFKLSEDLSYFQDQRKKEQLHVISARVENGGPAEWMQEPWEGGFTVVLPTPIENGQQFTLQVLVGSGSLLSKVSGWTYFPYETATWYPRYGPLRHSMYDVRFRHRKNVVIASVGTVVRDEAVPNTDNLWLTEYRSDLPVPWDAFSLGDYRIHKEVASMSETRSLPLEVYSLPVSDSAFAAVKYDFILAELSNCIHYFSTIFGDYPYPVFRAVSRPFSYGQGFPTTLIIPGADTATKNTFKFIAHETAHQWWGDYVLWRSYRDVWLSEGFAEYSGLLYTQTRDKTVKEKLLIQGARESLLQLPPAVAGVQRPRIEDVGPLIMGERLGAGDAGMSSYALIYNKGALVLRMLHFLFTDPQTGDGRPFFDMMADFVRQHANGVASTEDFFAVANEHLAQTPLARQFGYKDLNWFYRQWVLQTYLPSYRLTYHLQDRADGSVVLVGTLTQDGVPDSEHWFMPLPLWVTYSKGQIAIVPIAVQGKESPVEIKLLERPEKVELDPELWVLSEKTSISIKR